MRNFICDSCNSLLYFENDTCLECGRKVGFRSDTMTMGTTQAAEAAGLVLCQNWTQYNACNWFANPAAENANGYCLACALNEVVPNLRDGHRRELWVETERAKRRLVFTLLQLGLPLHGPHDKPGLRFRLLADARVDTGAVEPPPQEPVYTGHENGRLTLNVAEADDVHREAMRKRLNEPYRTMLGHLRHESGHYYWYLLVEGTSLLPAFRAMFGNEQADYDSALKQHYEAGAPPGWEMSFVSTYASSHPWEDFAETWAHYIHIVDTLETANTCLIAIGTQQIATPLPPKAQRAFTEILEEWRALSVSLNQLNRSMGMHDAYPFVLAERVVAKLDFIHQLCVQTAAGTHAPLTAGTVPSSSYASDCKIY